MYSVKRRVSFSQTGEDRKMSIHSIIDVMQDLSCEHSDSLGVGSEYLREQNRAWLLNTWHIVFDRYPEDNESYTAETRPWKFEKFFGHRNFALIDEQGEYMVRANSLWFFVNTERMRPTLPDPALVATYPADEPIPMDYSVSRKLSVPEGLAPQESFPVRRIHLDRFHHVNNGQYILMAQEYLPADREVAELRVEYRNAAVYGDRIFPYAGVDEDGWHTVVLGDGAGGIYVILKAKLR